jgi:drug/metabolite transporter (DMT)-like permease
MPPSRIGTRVPLQRADATIFGYDPPVEPGRDIRGPACGLLAASLFGLGAPLGKILVSHAGPVALASVLYLSAGIVLSLIGPLRDRSAEAPLRPRDAPVLAVIAVLGGIIGPVLMLYGLARVSGVTGALLLNLEAPATILLAVCVFGEHLGRREILAAALVIVGAAILAAEPASRGLGGSQGGAVALAGACLAWGVDNNLTQRLSLRDPVALVRLKALAAGCGSLVIAFALGDSFPAGRVMVGAIAVGALSYGLSILLDAYALRFVGAAREAAYFATAPFFGALVAVPLLGERLGSAQLAAAALMVVGIWGLLRERHTHEHVHAVLTHEHAHVHDTHHRHDHAPGTRVEEPHSHVHSHTSLSHDHPHVPDAHHRHRH